MIDSDPFCNFKQLPQGPEHPQYFVTLPPELREAIYDLALVEDESDEPVYLGQKAFAHNKYRSPNVFHLLSECRATRRFKMYTAQHNFMLCVNLDAGFDEALSWVRTMMSAVKWTAGQSLPFKSLSFRITGGAWVRFEKFAPVVELLYEMNAGAVAIEDDRNRRYPYLAGIGKAEKIHVILPLGHHRATRAVETLLDISEEAANSAWSKKKLQEEVVNEVRAAKHSRAGRRAAQQNRRREELREVKKRKRNAGEVDGSRADMREDRDVAFVDHLYRSLGATQTSAGFGQLSTQDGTSRATVTSQAQALGDQGVQNPAYGPNPYSNALFAEPGVQSLMPGYRQLATHATAYDTFFGAETIGYQPLHPRFSGILDTFPFQFALHHGEAGELASAISGPPAENHYLNGREVALVDPMTCNQLTGPSHGSSWLPGLR